MSTNDQLAGCRVVLTAQRRATELAAGGGADGLDDAFAAVRGMVAALAQPRGIVLDTEAGELKMLRPHVDLDSRQTRLSHRHTVRQPPA